MSNTKSIKACTQRESQRQSTAKAVAMALAVFALAATQHTALAGSEEQAKRMFDRLTGTPPTPAQLSALAGSLPANSTQAQRADVAYTQILSTTNGRDFYRVVLKNFATPWTNRDQTAFAPLNDYTAIVIGTVRDNRDFREILSEDVLYVGSGAPPSATSNAHFEALESTNADLQAVLTRTSQSAVYGIPAAATAGVITSRAASEAFFIDGTNRAMFRFTLLNHLCRDMEQMHDTTRPTDRIRQDISRSPGGDSAVFLNNCVGCHNGMDPMAQAFAYYDFDETQGRLVYTPGVVQPKYLINADNFKPGYVTPNDSWENRWRLPGQNTAVGWSNQDGQVRGGNGAKTLGQELANSDAFAECQVEKVFRTVCFRPPSDGDDSQFSATTTSFKSTGNLKRVFAEVAAHCAGE
jgi:hypothetical protein